MGKHQVAAKHSHHSRHEQSAPIPETLTTAPPLIRCAEPIEARTLNQKRFIAAIKTRALVFGVGPAGTGKTWLSVALAAQALINKKAERIIITRPAVEAGENLGFLPGEMDEKFAPYLVPYLQVFYERLGRGPTEYFLKSERIEAIPLAYMRGRTFKNAVVILDEAQNVSKTQMKMFLTRIGENCAVIVNGDPDQTDVLKGELGLEDAIARCSHIPEVAVVRFDCSDVVRSSLAAEIVIAYNQPRPLTSCGDR